MGVRQGRASHSGRLARPNKQRSPGVRGPFPVRDRAGLASALGHADRRKDRELSETGHGARIVQAFREHRPYLIDLAFRMLGDIGAAEDAVQDAFTRMLAADVGEIEDERGWLIVVTSRLCLDRIRSARTRRERPHDSAEIEFVAPPAAGRLADPADRVTLDDSVSLALLVVLQRLSPAERVVFVLHDIFGMPFPAVAETVGRAAPACRQLARRARQKIAEGQSGARFDVAAAEHRAVTEKFIAACASGDLEGLLAVLAPDAWGDIDLGPDGPPREIGRASCRER